MSRIVNATRGFRVAFDGVVCDNWAYKTAPTENVCTVSTGASPTLHRSAN